MSMITNFEVIKDFNNARDMAETFSKSGFCCQKLEYKRCSDIYSPTELKTQCFRCWLDFLTNDSGLYAKCDEEKEIGYGSKLKLTEKSKERLRGKQDVR